MASGSWLAATSCNRPATCFSAGPQAQAGRQYYIRQLKDMKIKPLVELFTPGVMLQYAEFCGWALAHAHARSGEPAKISGYLGKSDVFDQAIAAFSTGLCRSKRAQPRSSNGGRARGKAGSVC